MTHTKTPILILEAPILTDISGFKEAASQANLWHFGQGQNLPRRLVMQALLRGSWDLVSPPSGVIPKITYL